MAEGSAGPEFKAGTSEWWGAIAVSLVCICGAGMFSGLTMGVIGLDPTMVAILARAGTEEQKKQAQRVQWFLSPQGYHHTLVTLLVSNAVCCESLPLFLDKAVGEVASIILGSTFVLLFGEILPISFFTGPNQLKIAAMLTPVVLVLLVLLSPVAWPISKLLDCISGHAEETKFRRAELVEFVRMHEADASTPRPTLPRQESALGMELQSVPAGAAAPAGKGKTGALVADGEGMEGHVNGGEGGVQSWLSSLLQRQEERGEGGAAGEESPAGDAATLTAGEVKILTGVLGMVKKTAASHMTPLRRVFMLPSTARLDRDTMREVTQSGYSRIPIFDADRGRQTVVGVFIPKLLLRVDPDNPLPIDVLTLLQPPFVYESTHLLDVLDVLRAAKTHLAVVVQDPPLDAHGDPSEDLADHQALGIVTLEDVLEELIMEKIGDESQILVGEDTKDRFRRVASSRKKPARKAAAATAATAPSSGAVAAPRPVAGAAVLSGPALEEDGVV